MKGEVLIFGIIAMVPSDLALFLSSTGKIP